MNSAFTTHEVLNQSPPFENVNLFTSDRALMEAVNREGGGAAVERLTSFGKACGSADAFERGRGLAEALATVASGAILRAHAPAYVADAFIATRLSGGAHQTYGQGLEWADTRAIIARASAG